jgi:hypothetical protein
VQGCVRELLDVVRQSQARPRSAVASQHLAVALRGVRAGDAFPGARLAQARLATPTRDARDRASFAAPADLCQWSRESGGGRCSVWRRCTGASPGSYLSRLSLGYRRADQATGPSAHPREPPGITPTPVRMPSDCPRSDAHERDVGGTGRMRSRAARRQGQRGKGPPREPIGQTTPRPVGRSLPAGKNT